MSQLDLTSFACGSRQHVFLPTRAPDCGWVFKLPSARGVVEQYGLELREYQPTGPLASVLYRAFVQLPNDRHDQRLAALRRQGAPEQQLQSAQRRHRAICETRGQTLAVAYRWTRRRHFRRMVALAESMAERGLGDLMLPFRVLHDAAATIRVAGEVEQYRGPILVQRRGDFFDRSGRFDAFDWSDVIVTQHRLWREGIGLSDANEILGPKNWALVSGRLRLADFSSLTRSARTVRRLLSPGVLDARQDRVLQRLSREGTSEMADLARSYFAHVRAEINQSRFDQLWLPRTAPLAAP